MEALWVPCDVASKATGIGISTLRALQKAGQLQPGEHWVYLSGLKQSKVGWSIEALRRYQVEATKRICADQQNKADGIESYEEVPTA